MQRPDRFEADVISTFGRHLLLRDAQGQQLRARPFGRDLQVVCGDRVVCEADAHQQVLVRSVLPRRSVLLRSNARGRSEPIVANLTLAVVVVAAVPRPDPFMIDRYLCAAASAGLAAVLVVNKADLPLRPEDESALAELASLGVPIHRVSALHDQSLQPLAAALASHTGVLLGQSGVGKSSLIRRLAIDGESALTGDLMRDAEGRHTTTASRLYDCPGGGRLIDSPGVRDYAPAVDQLDPASLGFIEIDRLAPGCRFADCRHLQEPGCAVIAAVATGAVAARRYESYRRLRRLYQDLLQQRAPGSERR